jgi:P-type Mg2+ transporter
MAVAALLPVSPLAGALGFTPLPLLFWPRLAAMLVAYLALTQAVKVWFVRRYGE